MLNINKHRPRGYPLICKHIYSQPHTVSSLGRRKHRPCLPRKCKLKFHVSSYEYFFRWPNDFFFFYGKIQELYTVYMKYIWMIFRYQFVFIEKIYSRKITFFWSLWCKQFWKYQSNVFIFRSKFRVYFLYEYFCWLIHCIVRNWKKKTKLF